MAEGKSKRARIQLALIALLFFGPLVVAAFLYYGGYLQGLRASSNHGVLLSPVVSLTEQIQESPALEAGSGHWVLVSLLDGPCDETCEATLYKSRQCREMLGRDRDRLVRVLLHGAEAPDTVFLSQEHPDLITTGDTGLSDALNNNSPAMLSGQDNKSAYYLIDPLGNLVMIFEADLAPSKMVEDIEHLLRLSRIG